MSMQRAIASSAARPLKSRQALNRATTDYAVRGARAQYHRNLVIDVPRTCLPSDVVRALKNAGLVPSTFSERFVTAPPPGAHLFQSNTSNLITTYHVQMEDPKKANKLLDDLLDRPLFVGMSSAKGASGRPALAFNSDSQLAYNICARLCSPNVQGWVNRYLKSFERMSGTPGDIIDADWVLMPGMSGRRVTVSGVPVQIDRPSFRSWLTMMSEGKAYDPVRLPTPRSANSTAWVVTCDSVADAYVFQRAVHLTQFNPNWAGARTLRAEINW